MKKIFTTLLLGAMTTTAFAQWSPSSMKGDKVRPETEVKAFYNLDLNILKSKLNNAVEAGRGAVAVEISLPTLDGKIERFAVYSAPVMVKSLADKYQLGSYSGVGIDDPSKFVRFSIAPNDFQSMMFSNGKYEFIEPLNSDKSVYGVFPKSKKSDGSFDCHGESLITKQQLSKLAENANFSNLPTDYSRNSDQKYRTYRLAISVTGEYTQFFGGTVAGALAGVNATMTRVNGVFEKDFAIHMILQDFPQLIFTDPNTDPYSGATAGAGGAWSRELQNTLTTTIGNAAYDIGHLFGRSGGGGSAGDIGNVCRDAGGPSDETSKGSAFTSPGAGGNPVGDTFDIDYVAHEMGHQFGAWHTFAHGIHSGSIAHMEPGSGSTIMGYAGITSADVQPHSDPYFHAVSIFQVQNYVNTQSCDVRTTITNQPPVVAAMADKTIPKSTAFLLTASATDPESDPITYTWEQYDSATAAVTNVTLNNTQGPKFRSFIGTTAPYRYFPKMSMVMAGNLGSQSEWESVSNVARVMNFRVTVRDNNANVSQQQTQFGSQKITVGNDGPFKVTSTKVYNNAAGPLTWDVVNTSAAPYNVANVKIDYTTDNGANWTVLSASTPNDGTEDFNFSTFATGTNLKVRVSAIDNVFYAVGNVVVSQIVLCDGSAPVNIVVSNITAASAVVTWDAISGATYNFRYRKVGDATWNESTISANTITLSGLLPATNYEYQVAAICSGTTGTYSNLAQFTTLSPQYCTAGATSTSFEKISNVQFANINNNSTSTAGYENFTNVVGDVIIGNSYTFTSSFSGTSFSSDQVKVWIDFNHDYDFDDQGEEVMVSATKVSPWTGTIVIPTNAMIGATRMRVRLHDTAYTPNYTPCGTSSYGQVEDYTLNIGTLVATSENSLADIQVYPNPATDVLNVTKVSNNAVYTIHSISGQVVAKGKVADNKVAVSNLQKGVYIISVEDKGNVSKVKFIKK